MDLHELHEHVRRFERNRKMVKVICPESDCPWCNRPAKYVKSRSDASGRNTGVHVFFCNLHGYFEGTGDGKGKPIRGNEV